jgi:poly(3-hydroxybutyrate) depolymerase
VHVPPTYDPKTPAKLLVALHGDEGTSDLPSATAGVISLWRTEADAHGYIVLALACSSEIQCNGAWDLWAYAGQPVPASVEQWIDQQISTVETRYNVASKGKFVTGYSGGAYFLSWYALSHASKFGGVAFVAGGMPYWQALNGCPTCKIPGYFLGGDQDPRTGDPNAMSGLLSQFSGCSQPFVTDLVAGADHSAAIESLASGRGDAILTWFDARPLGCQ